MTIKSELQSLLRQHKGLLKAETVVAWAEKNTKSALHKAIEWDDSKAAYQHRLQQVRSLIALHVVVKGGGRKFVSLSIDRIKPGGGYRDIDDVMSSAQLRQVRLKEAWSELERLRRKYEELKEFVKVWSAIKQVGKTFQEAA